MARPLKNYQEVLRSYPRSRKVNSVSLGAEALYLRLLVLADCAGRHPADPAVVASLVFAERLRSREVTFDQVGEWLQELATARLVELYEVEGEPLLRLLNYFRTANNRVEPTYPGPPVPNAPQPVSPIRPQCGDEVVPDTSPMLPQAGDSTRRDETRREQDARAEAREVVVPDTDFPWPDWVDPEQRDGWVRQVVEETFALRQAQSADCYLDGIRQAIAQYTAPEPGEGAIEAAMRSARNPAALVVSWLKGLEGSGVGYVTGALRKGPLSAAWWHPRLRADSEATKAAGRARRETTRA